MDNYHHTKRTVYFYKNNKIVDIKEFDSINSLQQFVSDKKAEYFTYNMIKKKLYYLEQS